MAPPARPRWGAHDHEGRVCWLHLQGPQAGLDEDPAGAAHLHGLPVHSPTPPPPGRHRFPVWTATMPRLAFQSHPRSPKYIQIRRKEFLSPSLPPGRLCPQLASGGRRPPPSSTMGPGASVGSRVSKGSLSSLCLVVEPLFSGSGGAGFAKSQGGWKPAGVGWPWKELGASRALSHAPPIPTPLWGPPTPCTIQPDRASPG